MKTFEWLSNAAAVSDPFEIGRIANNREIDLFYRLSALSAQVYRDDLKESAREYYREMIHQSQYSHDPLPPEKMTEFEEYLQSKIMPLWENLETENQINHNLLLNLKSPVFILQFHFKLRHPLISRDDNLVHPIDNPMRKEHVFKLPMISATSWKGLFRNVELINVWQKLMSSNLSEKLLDDLANDLIALTHLTGNLKEEKFKEPENEREKRWNRLIDVFNYKLNTYLKFNQDESVNYAGSLRFYPTFFRKLDLEIINPHDRERRVGTNPILIEAVPKGEIGLFQMVYLQQPFWRFTKSRENVLAAKKQEWAEKSLKISAQTMQLLFSELGIGAKRSSGYGSITRKLPSLDGFRGKLFSNFLNAPDQFKPVLKFSELNELMEFAKGGLHNESE